MKEKMEVLTAEKSEAEQRKFLPEVTANPPLKNTTLIYSVPVLGEWRNGNTLRLLRAMLSQKPAHGEACEIEILANNGEYLNDLAARRQDDPWLPLTDEKGEVMISDKPTNLSGKPINPFEDKKAREVLADTAAGVEFLKRAVEVQGLAEELIKKPKDKEAAEKLAHILEQIEDPIQKDILLLAKKAAGKVSLALIDASRKSLRYTAYKGGMGGLRTLGADVALARFEGAKNAVLALFDADTVLDSTHAVQEIQTAFQRQPNLNYVFLSLQHLPAGTSKELVAGAPAYNIGHSQYYQSFAVHHGSPQICFRLKAYERLQEIAGWTLPGFQGDEDRDTAVRLVYHFGALQDGLLFENGATYNLFPSVALTGDRLDGSFDSKSRPKAEEARSFKNEVSEVQNLRQQMYDLMASKPKEQRNRIEVFLEKARHEYLKRQRLQWRFNRLIGRSFLQAIERGFVRLIDHDLRIDEVQVMSLSGGKALVHYARDNQAFVKQLLNDTQDLAVLKYFLGQAEDLPADLKELTHFQQALREYLGEFPPPGFFEHEVKDDRAANSKISYMHATLVELMALGHTYRTFFETPVFLASRKFRGEYVTDKGETVPIWPDDPKKQKLDWHYGEQAQRIADLKKRLPAVRDQAAGPWYRQLSLTAFPIFEAFKRLINR